LNPKEEVTKKFNLPNKQELAMNTLRTVGISSAILFPILILTFAIFQLHQFSLKFQVSADTKITFSTPKFIGYTHLEWAEISLNSPDLKIKIDTFQINLDPFNFHKNLKKPLIKISVKKLDLNIASSENPKKDIKINKPHFVKQLKKIKIPSTQFPLAFQFDLDTTLISFPSAKTNDTLLLDKFHLIHNQYQHWFLKTQINYNSNSFGKIPASAEVELNETPNDTISYQIKVVSDKNSLQINGKIERKSLTTQVNMKANIRKLPNIIESELQEILKQHLALPIMVQLNSTLNPNKTPKAKIAVTIPMTSTWAPKNGILKLNIEGNYNQWKTHTTISGPKNELIDIQGTGSGTVANLKIHSENHYKALGPFILPLNADIKFNGDFVGKWKGEVLTEQGSFLTGSGTFMDIEFTGFPAKGEPWVSNWTQHNVLLKDGSMIVGKFNNNHLYGTIFGKIEKAYGFHSDSIQVSFDLDKSKIEFKNGLLKDKIELIDLDGKVEWLPEVNWEFNISSRGESCEHGGNSLIIFARCSEFNLNRLPLLDTNVQKHASGIFSGYWTLTPDKTHNLQLDWTGSLLDNKSKVYLKGIINQETINIDSLGVNLGAAKFSSKIYSTLNDSLFWADSVDLKVDIPNFKKINLPIDTNIVIEGQLKGKLQFNKNKKNIVGILEAHKVQVQNSKDTLLKVDWLKVFPSNQSLQLLSAFTIKNQLEIPLSLHLLVSEFWKKQSIKTSLEVANSQSGKLRTTFNWNPKTGLKGSLQTQGDWELGRTGWSINSWNTRGNLAWKSINQGSNLLINLDQTTGEINDSKNISFPFTLKGSLEDSEFMVSGKLQDSEGNDIQTELIKKKSKALQIRASANKFIWVDKNINAELTGLKLWTSQKDSTLQYFVKIDSLKSNLTAVENLIIKSSMGFVGNYSPSSSRQKNLDKLQGNVSIQRLNVTQKIQESDEAIWDYVKKLFSNKSAPTDIVARTDSHNKGVALDININDESNGKLNALSNMYSIPLTLDLTLKGNSNYPILNGYVQTIGDGYLKLSGSRYNLEQGAVNWNSNKAIEGIVDIQASRALSLCAEKKSKCLFTISGKGPIKNLAVTSKHDCGEEELPITQTISAITSKCISMDGTNENGMGNVSDVSIGIAGTATKGIINGLTGIKLIENINGHLNYSDLEDDSSSLYVSWKVPYVNEERALINMGYITKQNSSNNDVKVIEAGAELLIYPHNLDRLKNPLTPRLTLDGKLQNVTESASDEEVEENQQIFLSASLSYTQKFWDFCLFGWGNCKLQRELTNDSLPSN
jgi:hypothetical protein